MKYYVFGDIHGELQKLENILGQITLGKDEQLVFLGDYVDRGKRSAQVVELLIRLKKEGAIVIKGNHDEMLVNWSKDRNKIENLYWERNYLSKTKKSYYKLGWSKFPEHISFIDNLPLMHCTPTFSFTHSGAQNMLWGRENEDVELFPGLYNIHGHTPLERPYFGKNRSNLDTGACFGGKLTCAVFEEGVRKPLEVIQE